MKMKNGLAFPDADQYLFDRIPEQGVWQDDALKAGLSHCKKFRLALDCGAHIGTWSIELSKTFETVIAFEPAPDTFECLEVNTKKIGNIYCNQKAIGKKEKMVSMTMTDKDVERKHTGARFIKRGGDINCISIDSLRLEDVDFIKLDLEGGEPDAVIGAIKTLHRCKPVVVFEDKGFQKRFNYLENATRLLLTKFGAVEFERCGINRVWGWSK